jgi:abortive infection bacteriophage resistance protein
MDFVHLYLFITTGGVAIYTSRTFFQISNERSKSIFPRRAFELSEHVQRLMNKHMTACLVNVCAIRLETNNFYNEIPTIPQFQKNWDNINIKRIIANDLIFNSPMAVCTVMFMKYLFLCNA